MQICIDNATNLHFVASDSRMLKRERQNRILALIRAERIGTQEELRAQLERAGVPATQSSVSRDLEELGVVKHHGFYALPQANGDGKRGLVSLDVAGDVLVIAKCLPGRASGVAVEIDDAADGLIVFRNSATDTVTVLFRRADGNLGLIEPEA